MKKNAVNACKAGNGVNVLNVKSESTPDKKFNASDAETVTPIEEVKNQEAGAEPQEHPQNPPKQEIVALPKEEKKMPTLQEYKDRATILFLLQEKHTKLLDQKNRLDRFKISHDEQTAEIILRDANGMEFRSSSPMTVGEVLGFCQNEFSALIAETETNLRKAFAF